MHRPSLINTSLVVFLAAALSLAISGCASKSKSHPDDASTEHRVEHSPEPGEESAHANIFDEYLHNQFDPADGFDFPFGDRDGRGTYIDRATGKSHTGWYIATHFAEQYSLGIHPGEDWNGSGGGDTDLGQDVRSVANGRVVFAKHCGKLWGNVIVIEHLFYENHEKKSINSLYAHLKEIKVRAGEKVKRRQLIATIGQDPDKLFSPHLHLELRWNRDLEPTYWPSSDGKDVAWVRKNYAEPAAFINAHRSLPVPRGEDALILIDHESYAMRIYRRGKLHGRYDISLGQEKGRKRVQGDNKTPKGMYFTIEKQRGNIPGNYGEYFGGHWIKINYPNRYDAAWGRAEGLISPQQETAIRTAWEKRGLPPQGTKLGGGIGFHGWIEEWKNDGPRHLSWGCVVMHLKDIRAAYDDIPKGAMVVIF